MWLLWLVLPGQVQVKPDLRELCDCQPTQVEDLLCSAEPVAPF